MTAFPYTNTMETLFDSALVNGKSISDVPTPGQEYYLVEPDKKNRTASRPVLPVFVPVQKVVKNDRQNLPDLSIQTTGSFENLFEFALLNGVQITDEGVPGQVYDIPGENIDKEILRFFSARKIRPETSPARLTGENGLFENGLFEFGLFE